MARFVFGIPMYNLFVGIGIVSGILMFYHLCKKENIPSKYMDNIILLLVISLFTGFFSSAAFDNFVHGKFNVIDIHTFFAGFTFYGGFIGGFVTILIGSFILLKEGNRIYQLLNILAICMILGHAIGRIGCFLGGCCYGISTDSILGVIFPIYDVNGSVTSYSKVLPTQLYEAGFLLVLFAFVYNRRERAFTYYFMGYGVFRFLIEFIRGDNRGILIIDTLQPSQYISILLILIGVVLLIWRRRRENIEQLV